MFVQKVVVTACLAFVAVSAITTTTCDIVSDDRPCVPKCCPLGQSISDEDGSCQPSELQFRPYFDAMEDMYNSTEDEISDDYDYIPPPLLDHNNSYIIVGDPCKYHKFRLEPYANDIDMFSLLKNGSLLVHKMYPGVVLSTSDYCLETFSIKTEDTEDGYEAVLPLLCFKDPDDTGSIQFILYPLGLLISVPFLIGTMLVYCLLPELRNLHGKTLSCHVMCLATAYICLAIVQLGGSNFSENACVSLAFMIQFSFQACFFWLQVMCFNTWWIVRSSYKMKKNAVDELEEENEVDVTGVTNEAFDYVDNSVPESTVCCFPALVDGGNLPSKSTERKVFLCYSLYAWTLSIILIVISLMSDLIPTIPSSYIKPNFGLNKCWFNSQEAELNYFYGPVIYVLVTNLIMFIHTSYMICCINKWNNPGKHEKRCFMLCFSLFFVMGINWILEVVSWAVGGPPYIWHFTDFVNTLQGIITFCIFVLEPYVRSLVHRKLWPRVAKVMCKCNEASDTAQAQPTVRQRNAIVYSTVTNPQAKSVI